MHTLERVCPDAVVEDEWGKLYDLETLQIELTRLNIQPFSQRSVSHYKARMARRSTPMKTKALILLGKVSAATFMLAFVAALLGGFGSLVCEVIEVKSSTHLTCVVALLVGLVVFWISLHIMMQVERAQLVYATWKAIPVDLYRESAPKYARETFAYLRERCPNAKFFVEVLQLEERTIDPFLVVCLDGRTFYIEVWNEPDLGAVREY